MCNCDHTCNPNFPDDDTSCNGCTSCSQKCHEVVATAAEAILVRNAFVTVTEENAVYHVDEVGNLLLISRPPIFADNAYSPTIGDYKQVVVYQFTQNKFYVFDPTGAFKTGVLS